LLKRDAFLIYALVLIIFSSGILTAQDIKDTVIDKQSLIIPILKNDTSNFKRLGLENKTLKDTILRKENKPAPFKMRKSPWTAVGFSALFPGLGQFYNESYWKLPVIAVITGYLGYSYFYNNSKFMDYRDKYTASQDSLNPNGQAVYKSLREFYRNQRDQFFLYFGLFYLINLADAYVDAHLYDFNVSNKIRVNLFSNKSLLKLNFNF